MSITDSILEFIIKLFGKRVVWGFFNMLDWATNINKEGKLIVCLEDMKKTYEKDIELFSAEGDELEKLLKKKMEKSIETKKNMDEIEKNSDKPVLAGVIEGLEFETYTKEMYEEEKKTFNFDKSTKVLTALNQVIFEAKQVKFKHSLSKSMKRLEELTDFEMFSFESDE